MGDSEYNGWTNYATWRVCLEMFDGLPAEQVLTWWHQAAENDPENEPSVYALSVFLKKNAIEAIYEAVEPLKPPQTYRDITMPEIMAGWAAAFVNEVNFFEIAEHMYADYIETAENREA